MTAKNLPTEIIKLTEFSSVGFELHLDKHFNLLPVSFFIGNLLFSTVPTFVLYSIYLKTVLVIIILQSCFMSTLETMA